MPIANHRLDYAQTLKNAYDITLNRFRVDAEVHASFGDLEVSITADEDSVLVYGQDSGGTNRPIRIDTDGQLQVDVLSLSDGTDALEINPDGSLNVNVISSSTGLVKTSVNTFNEISSLASGSETIVATYTAPVAKVSYLIRAEGSGENIARYRVFLNGSPIARRYTYFGGALNTDFEFMNDDMELPGLKLVVGDIITVRVLHNRPTVADFSARIQSLEVG